MFKISKCFELTRKTARLPLVRYSCCGRCPPVYECKQPPKDEFHEEVERLRLRNTPDMFKTCHKGRPKLWKCIFLFVCVPAIVCAYINTSYLSPKNSMRPKFIEFEYLRIRRKPFPWDPVRTLFHNPRVNALPTGYEVQVPEEEEFDPFCPPEK